MSPQRSNSRPNLYERIRSSLRKGSVGSRVEELEEASIELVASAIEARDPAIASHCARVAELAARLTQHLALGRQNVELMRKAGMLHDLGVIGVSDKVLHKPGPLTGEEWDIMRRHPTSGLTSSHGIPPWPPLPRLCATTTSAGMAAAIQLD
jgi:HD-GYP domain-containing protein (c-di-GMP phosphodiesterase class II)